MLCNLQDGANQAVVICSEYLIYQANYYVGPLLSFSSNCIRIECSRTTCEKERDLSLVLEVDDLISISCQCLHKVNFRSPSEMCLNCESTLYSANIVEFEQVQLAFVKIRVISKDSFGKADNSSGEWNRNSFALS